MRKRQEHSEEVMEGRERNKDQTENDDCGKKTPEKKT
jgi:hypothetical protein